MSHAFVTIIAPVRSADIAQIRSAIETLGNPARSDITTALNALGRIHFASLNVFQASSGHGGHLVLEFSGDGAQDELLAEFAKAVGSWLAPVFQKTEDFSPSQDLVTYWRSKAIQMGQSYFSTTGLVFTGTPGMSVMRIWKESELAKHVAGILPEFLPTDSALRTLEQVRDFLRPNPSFDWIWQAKPTPLLAEETPLGKVVLPVAGLGIRAYLWPLAIPAVAGAVLDALFRKSWLEFLAVFVLVLAVELILLGWALYKFTQAEQSDAVDNNNPGTAKMSEIMKLENHCAQNHLDVHTVLKDEPLRGIALRVAFFVIGQLCARQFKPGFLGSIGSIHFARWVLVPGTRDLLFFSNYGGSWESYLEDFITKAHAGLTGVWSNTLGFPRTRFLFLQGATDGDRFKRWARGKQIPTYFWYSAYPHVTTSNIRINAMIRQGLAGASTEEEAREWLSLFGSAPHPAVSLETEEIQSLLFGGLSPLEESECILFRLACGSESPHAIRHWLLHVLPDISFGERVPENSALILGVTRSMLDQCGLPPDALASFPNAFLQGMTEPSRSRILGDVRNNEPATWTWGGPNNDGFDGAAILYAKDKQTLGAAVGRFENGLETFGHLVVWRIPLKCTPPHGNRKEPFGFRDGISQPVIRGTFRTQRPFDRIHLVEPGEFILGYADNRGYVPPTPEISPMFDPDNLLALVPGNYDPQVGFAHPVSEINRDLGRNGSFLVIRQLEQNVKEFRTFLAHAASSQFAGQPVGAVSREEWIAAKMFGRWPDGSSLVRNPSYPLSNKPSRSNPPPPRPDSKPTEPDNAFLFGVEDPQGLRCPFGAHIRRANPRESFDPGSTEQIAITNRHRILRSGRHYEERGKEGLLFVCLNADFERQFEFIQQTWILNPLFPGLAGEADPLLRGDYSGFFTVSSESGPLRIEGLSSFVRVKGGGYFFVPGKRTLAFLAQNVTRRSNAAR